MFKVGDKVTATRVINEAGPDTIKKGTRGTVTEVFNPKYNYPYTVVFDDDPGNWPIRADEIKA
jgi:hypothetical protein